MAAPRRRFLIVSTVAASALLGVPSEGPGTPASFPGNDGRIAFSVVAAGKGAWISSISPDGSRLRRMVGGRTEAFSPSWSADGRKLVFVMSGAVWRMNGDGKHLARVSRRGVVDPESPAWSPDGRQVVFAARTAGQSFDVYVCRVDGTNLRRLTRSRLADEHPRWSPDGRRIVFSRAGASGPEIWTMTASGRQQRRLGSGGTPDWSPGGTRIAYTRGLDVWVMAAAGRGAAQITHGPGMSGDPAWSPDGRWIVFWNDQAGGEATRGDLYLVRADGSAIRRLTYEPELWHFAPSWQALRRASPPVGSDGAGNQ
ncbi:MAG TPA: hypothetical protein VFU26_03750 [Gaiellaceae bacterium]|nr:hypothetical protein [Gaiellaceae bacterium]